MSERFRVTIHCSLITSRNTHKKNIQTNTTRHFMTRKYCLAWRPVSWLVPTVMTPSQTYRSNGVCHTFMKGLTVARQLTISTWFPPKKQFGFLQAFNSFNVLNISNRLTHTLPIAIRLHFAKIQQTANSHKKSSQPYMLKTATIHLPKPVNLFQGKSKGDSTGGNHEKKLK